MHRAVDADVLALRRAIEDLDKHEEPHQQRQSLGRPVLSVFFQLWYVLVVVSAFDVSKITATGTGCSAGAASVRAVGHGVK